MLAFLLVLSALADEPAAPFVMVGPETPPMPDITAEVVRGQCERPRTEKAGRRATPGADQHYTGRLYVGADGQVAGLERRLLFANTAWKAQSADWAHGSDCAVVWNVTGTRIAPTACTDCDFGVQFEANVDYASSTCPQRITTDGNHFRGAYDVKRNPDGTAALFFSNSGKPLGHGYWRGDSLVWLSDHQCQWF